MLGGYSDICSGYNGGLEPYSRFGWHGQSGLAVAHQARVNDGAYQDSRMLEHECPKTADAVVLGPGLALEGCYGRPDQY